MCARNCERRVPGRDEEPGDGPIISTRQATVSRFSGAAPTAADGMGFTRAKGWRYYRFVSRPLIEEWEELSDIFRRGAAPVFADFEGLGVVELGGLVDAGVAVGKCGDPVGCGQPCLDDRGYSPFEGGKENLAP